LFWLNKLLFEGLTSEQVRCQYELYFFAVSTALLYENFDCLNIMLASLVVYSHPLHHEVSKKEATEDRCRFYPDSPGCSWETPIWV